MKFKFKPLLPLLAFALAIGMLAGCSTADKQKKLAFAEVKLSSEPATPVAGKESKLTVSVNNPTYADQEAEVQLQINSKDTLPQLIDALREGQTYVATYSFPKSGSYNITIHMSYEEEHYAFAKPVEVGK